MFKRVIIASSLICLIIIIYYMIAYPLNSGRALLYTFLIIPVALIIADLGSREYISKLVDRKVRDKGSLVIQIMAIVSIITSGTIITRTYADMVFRNYGTWGIGVMYQGDILAVYAMSAAVICYMILLWDTEIVVQKRDRGKDTA